MFLVHYKTFVKKINRCTKLFASVLFKFMFHAQEMNVLDQIKFHLWAMHIKNEFHVWKQSIDRNFCNWCTEKLRCRWCLPGHHILMFKKISNLEFSLFFQNLIRVLVLTLKSSANTIKSRALSSLVKLWEFLVRNFQIIFFFHPLILITTFRLSWRHWSSR